MVWVRIFKRRGVNKGIFLIFKIIIVINLQIHNNMQKLRRSDIFYLLKPYTYVEISVKSQFTTKIYTSACVPRKTR